MTIELAGLRETLFAQMRAQPLPPYSGGTAILRGCNTPKEIAHSLRRTMNLFSKLFRRAPKRPQPAVTVHDPEAIEPHDLDNPFFDKDVQERMGAAISKSTRTK